MSRTNLPLDTSMQQQTYSAISPPRAAQWERLRAITKLRVMRREIVVPPCITADNPRRYDTSIAAHDYLQERLREIKLI